MKRILNILLLLVCMACTKNAGQEIYCDLTLELSLPSGAQIAALTVDNAGAGNYFRNLNTGEEYDFPVFVNGKCRMRVLKGVYVLGFDALAGLADGTGLRVRSAEHTTMLYAVSLVEDTDTVTLNLLEL